ncbi:MAG: pyrroline-5-carboxylate reductase [Candidatus Magasanikbacteria bacterium]|jgi:pyrroline-5-carboxylate reductase|nr:pyrroline-5-carboxylate reductase [Candidatus Magasanikbacteria bacterium]MBT4314934.1 pyrroline-5-carboxylate reductase [Candidatus Magasanikbacteria bacterium]MBT4546890.1 pyrroline-5-carboxylate reductase [Candidatus Magasanikbacteria bacterium]MBT6819196.1 pyrroline-5-carboxylate reductase [Candidatus Magasanikbacteria bacterium]
MKKITIIGAGTMGKIFLQACQNIFSGAKITATVNSDESVQKLKQEFTSIEVLQDNRQAVENSDLTILACKPQNFLEVAKEIKGSLKQDVLVISVMAGVSLKKLKGDLEIEKAVRTMPNLGARVGKSMTTWTCLGQVGEEDKNLIKKLLSSMGEELFLETEEKLNKATAVAGSGPGFFFTVVEEWLKAVEEFGFSESDAKMLLLQTIDGSNDLLQKGGGVSELREQVTSKGGVTEAGLKILQEAKLKELWKEVINEAFERVVELSNT